MGLPFLAFSDSKGNVYSHHKLRMVVGAEGEYVLPKDCELITLPKGSSLFYLPGRKPVGFNPDTGGFEQLNDFHGQEVFAAAASLIPGYLRLHHPSFYLEKKVDLPLWAYTACGFKSGRFVVSASRIDARRHQEPQFYDCKKVKEAIKTFEEKFKANRLYQHLANCAVNYNCLNAKNLFLRRWEAGIPTSPQCNARCLGCISYQEDSGFDASHKRLYFVPTAAEIVQVMTEHLKSRCRPMISFGQGCEGEPLLQSNNIAQAIMQTRMYTQRGRVHINSNGSFPARVEQLCLAGIDSFRFSLNSAQEDMYDLYFRPQGYRFDDVVKSIITAKKHKKFVAVNLLTFPGVTDDKREVQALISLIKKTRIDMIQWRNLNIDSQYYLTQISGRKLSPIGVLPMLAAVRKKFPKLKFGYFN